MNRNQRRLAKKQAAFPQRGAPAIQNMLNEALQHHQAGRLAEAERLYRLILEKDANQPDSLHLLGMIAYQNDNNEAAFDLISRAIRINKNSSVYHNNLGGVFKKLGKTNEAIASYTRAIALSPDYAEAHYNLGNMLREQGKADDAVTHFTHAIAFKPDYVNAYNNLGTAFKDLDRLDEAKANYEQALVLDPDLAEAHNNLGNILRSQGRPDDAITHYTRAIALNPDFAEAYNNLGTAFVSQGKLEDAAAYYEKAIALNLNCVDAYDNQAKLFFLKTPPSEWESVCKHFLQLTPLSKSFEHSLYVRLAIAQWTRGDCAALRETMETCLALSSVIEPSLDKKVEKNVTNMRVYTDVLMRLLAQAKTSSQFPQQDTGNKIVLIGDSHCLSYANTTLAIDGVSHKIISRLVMGCKAWHLGNKMPNQYKRVFHAAIEELPPRAKCFIAFGEIDCRFNEGIISHYKKKGGVFQNLVETCVHDFVQHVTETAKSREIDISFIAVPAPRVDHIRAFNAVFTPDDEALLIEVIRLFNDSLKRAAAEKSRRVIDVYSLTAGPDGNAHGSYHIDSYHLKPEALALAMGGGTGL
jgi:tetratricopeptide (TPR) repeat protein